MFISSLINKFTGQQNQQQDGSMMVITQPPVQIPNWLIITVFAVELVLAIWALFLAYRCGGRHQDRFIHMVFAFFFPWLYIIYYYVSGCGSFSF